MKKLFCKKIFKKKNRAFSLVEVLCAVVLLALVATPIIQALYSGMALNNKSRKMLAAADLASDTMEFVSSLSFEDFKYKQSGTDITVPGLKSYYWGNDIDPSHTSVEFSSFKLRSAQLLYPNGPHAVLNTIISEAPSTYGFDTADGWTNYTCNRSIVFEDVEMDGYKFKVKIKTLAPRKKVNNASGTPVYENFASADLTSEKYYCYDVFVEVIDPATGNVVSSASTTVPNKF